MDKKESKYREMPGINYSLLKKIEYHPKGIKKEMNEDSKALALGSLFDFLLTEDIEKKSEHFLILENVIQEPSNKVVINILKQIKETFNPENLNDLSESAIAEICKEFNFGGANWSDSTLKNKIVVYNDFYSVYFDERILILKKDYENALILTNTYKNSSFFKEIINDKSATVSFQEELSEEIDGILYKGKLDKVVFYNKTKTILPIDIKSTQDYLPETADQVAYKILKFRYDLQGSLYTNLLRIKYPEWNVLPLNFKFSSYLEPEKTPVTVEMTEDQINKSRYGFEYNNKKYKGWEQLAQEYLYYQYEIGSFETHKECLENNFLFKLDL